MVGEGEARRLYINYNRRGWNRAEPLDEDTEIESPRLVRRAIEVIVENRLLELYQMAVALPFNSEDIEKLATLPIGYFDEDSAYNWAIKTLEKGFQ